MGVSAKRFKLAQQAELNFWRELRSCYSARRAKARDYWYIGILKKQVILKPDHKVLDVGCGPRGVTNYLVEGQRFGLDPLMDFYSSEFNMPKGVGWVKGCGEHMPFRKGSFDIIITTNTLDHTQNPEKVLSEISRVLKARAFLFLTVNTYPWRVKMIRVLFEKIGIGDPPHPHTFTIAEVERILNESGFQVLVTLHRIPDLWTAATKETTVILRARNKFTRAMQIWRQQGCKELLKASSYSISALFVFSRVGKQSVYLCIKRS